MLAHCQTTATVGLHAVGTWDLSKEILTKIQVWGNTILRRVYDRRWGSTLQEYRGESAEYFGKV